MELITNALKVFNDLDTTDLASDRLTEQQANLLPQRWHRALTEQQRVAGQIRLLYTDEEITRSFAETLAMRVTALRVVFDNDVKKCLGLAYMFEVSSEPRQMSFLFAPHPAQTEGFSETEARLGGRLPQEVKRFLSIHDGLSVEGNFGMGFRSSRKLSRLDNLDPETNYQYGNVICFAGDGLGNQFCAELFEESDVVLDWDHEDRSLKRLGPFWEVGTKIVRSFMYLG